MPKYTLSVSFCALFSSTLAILGANAVNVIVAGPHAAGQAVLGRQYNVNQKYPNKIFQNV